MGCLLLKAYCANSSKYGHAFNLVCLKSIDSTWQENRSNDSGNPFQEPVLHIGDIIFPSNSHDSRHSLQSQAFNKK